MKAKSWFNLHHFCGFFFGLLLLWVSLSGTLAVISYEVQYLWDDKFRATTDYQGQTNWSALQHNVAAAYPGWQIQDVRLQASNYHAAEIRIRNQETVKYLYFDAASGALTGEGSYGRFSRFLRDLHRNLSMGAMGKWVVCSLSLLLLGLLISAFKVYQHWWRGFLRIPKFKGLHLRTFWSDCHKVMGVYSLWFLAIITATGLFYLLEHALSQFDAPIYQAPIVVTEPSSQPPLPFNQLLEQANRLWPTLEIRGFSYPSSHADAFVVRGQADAPLTIDRGNSLWLNLYTGQELARHRSESLPFWVRVGDGVDLFHFGTIGGLYTKVIWFLFGLALCLLSLSGMRMYWLRVKRQSPTALKWLGVSGIASVMIIVLSSYLTLTQFAHYPNREGLAPVLSAPPLPIKQ